MTRSRSGHRVVMIAMLATVVLGVGGARGEEPEPPPAEEVPSYEEEILVTATRRAEETADVPASVTVVTPRQIEASPVTSLDAVLTAEVPGFTLGRPGSESYSTNSITSQDVNLRGLQGGGGSRTLVLLDGVPLNDPVSGFIDWGRIALQTVERVEVVRTATTTAWGNQAMGGVIHILTRRPEGRAFLGLVEAGSGELKRAEFSLSQAFERHGVVVGGKLFDYGGFFAHSAERRGPVDVKRSAEQESVNAEWRFDPSAASSYHAGAHWSAERRTTDTRLDENDADQLTLRAGGRWTRAQSVWEARAYSLRQQQTQGRGSANAARTVVNPNSDQYDGPASAWGATAQWSRALGERHVVLAGADWLDSEADVKENFRFSAGRFTRRRFFGGATQLGGLFLEDDFRPSERWSLRLGGRVDQWDSTEGRRGEIDLVTGATVSNRRLPDHSVTVFSPSIAGVFHARPSTTVRASLYSGFRAPLLSEMYRPSRGVGAAANESNPEVDPERLKGAEVGLRFEPRRGLWLDLAGYWIELEDPIILRTVGFVGPGGGTIQPCGVLPANGVCRQRDNVGALRSRGLEATVDWDPSPRWNVLWNHAFGESVITEAPGEEQLVGKWSRQVPKHSSNLSLSWSDPRWLTVRAQGRYFGRRYQDDLNIFPLEEHVLLDLMVSRDLGSIWTVQAGARNVLDEEYLIQNDAADQELGPPRRFSAGVRLRLGDR